MKNNEARLFLKDDNKITLYVQGVEYTFNIDRMYCDFDQDWHLELCINIALEGECSRSNFANACGLISACSIIVIENLNSSSAVVSPDDFTYYVDNRMLIFRERSNFEKLADEFNKRLKCSE